jgi:hypothetical protein
MITFGDTRVYTVTCTCRAGVDVDDLEALAAKTRLAPPDCKGVLFCRSPSGVTRGDAPRAKANARPFGKQITFKVRCPSQEGAVHVKLFGNGTMQTAGAKRPDIAYEAASLTCEACGFPDPPIDLTVRMINAGFRASCRLNLLACFKAARASGMMVSYDPCCYSALKVSLFFPKDGSDGHACRCPCHCATKRPRNRLCRMITVSVFESGSIGVSGGVSDDHVEKAGALIRRAIMECPDARQPTADEIVARLRLLAAA